MRSDTADRPAARTPGDTPRRPDAARVALWVARVAWASLVVLEGPLVAAALAAASRPVQVVGSVGAWAGWAAVLGITLVPAPVSLTAYRLLAPMALVIAVLGAVRDGVSTATAAVAVAAALVATTSAVLAEVGELFVQGGAYGDERRFPLRPPGPLVLSVLPIGWLVAAGAAVAGPMLLAARRWPSGVVLTVLAAGWGYVFARRCHRLTRRFAVFVPAGFVLHDHVVLADTAMFRASSVRSLRLAPADSEAANATGSALGLAVELGLADTGTIVLAATRAAPQGRALHVRSVLFTPSRPGRLLAAAHARHWA